MKGEEKMNSIYLEHALIRVQDSKRSVEFYRKLFPDWIVRWEGASSSGGRWVHFGPKEDSPAGYLSLHEESTFKKGKDGYHSEGIAHIGFRHPNVMDLVSRVVKMGVEIDDQVEDEHYRRVYFLDPDGNLLEFVEKREKDLGNS